MPASNKDIESASGYGSIPTSEEARTVEQADAEEGPFPVDIKSMLIAEFFGTCVYVQLGVAAECAALYTKSSVPLSVVWGAAFTLGIYVSAALSGGHLNPALTFSFALVRPADFRFRKLLPYWIAQYLGAFAAGAINLFLFHRAIGHFEKKSGIIRGTMQGIESAAAFGDYFTLHNHDVRNEVHAFFIEAFGTAVLAFVLFALTHPKNPLPGAAIPVLVGTAYGVLYATLGPLTGAALNPARDLGPRLVTLCARWGLPAMLDWLPYQLGPIFGGPVGAFVADKILML